MPSSALNDQPKNQLLLLNHWSAVYGRSLLTSPLFFSILRAMPPDASALMNAGAGSEPGGIREKQTPVSTAPALKRVVGLGGLAFSCFNSILGSGIFTIPALAAAVLGPAAILAYLICAVLAGLMGLCFAE